MSANDHSKNWLMRYPFDGWKRRGQPLCICCKCDIDNINRNKNDDSILSCECYDIDNQSFKVYPLCRLMVSDKRFVPDIDSSYGDELHPDFLDYDIVKENFNNERYYSDNICISTSSYHDDDLCTCHCYKLFKKNPDKKEKYKEKDYLGYFIYSGIFPKEKFVSVMDINYIELHIHKWTDRTNHIFSTFTGSINRVIRNFLCCIKRKNDQVKQDDQKIPSWIVLNILDLLLNSKIVVCLRLENIIKGVNSRRFSVDDDSTDEYDDFW